MIPKARFGDLVRVDVVGPSGLVVGIRGELVMVDVPIFNEDGVCIGSLEEAHRADDVEVLRRAFA